MQQDLQENNQTQPSQQHKKINTKRYFIWLPLWVALGIAFGIFIGSLFSKSVDLTKTLFVGGSNKLDAVIGYINEAYVDTVNTDELIESAIPKLVNGLDPHSTYISAKDMELIGDDLEGHFSGIGVQFTLRHDTITVISVIAGGPSQSAGVFPGDRIVYVNDSLFAGAGITNEKVMRGLRGEKGSEVKLGIKRTGEDHILDINVERGDIPVNTIDIAYSPIKNIGYIKISKFGATTYNEFKSAITKLKNNGAESFIVDLRQNSGGYLNAVIQMLNEFLEKGELIVYTEGRAFPRSDSYANGSGTSKNNQLVVLIDEGSASASEIFAGAIQDHDRGLIIGRRSFGKGLVQDQKNFKDGSALRLTIARYYTPSGRCIQKPYKLGDDSDYGQDLMNRYLRGELDSQDSIKQENDPLFYTDGGRPVHSNGGIMPDIFVARDTIGLNSYYLSLVNNGLVYEYAFDYTDKNRKKLEQIKNWKELDTYLSQQPLIVNLIDLAQTKGIKYRPHMLQECRDLLTIQLKANIIRNMLGESGFYPFILKSDIVLQKAIDAIKKEEVSVNAIREEKYKASDPEVTKNKK